MKIVNAQEVLDRNKDLIAAVTGIISDWLDPISDIIELPSTNIELAIMPSPYILDESEMPVQWCVFYDETAGVKPKQIQIAGIWLAGMLDSDAEGEDAVTMFEPSDPRFTRSVMDGLTALLLEVKHAQSNGIPLDARELVRIQLQEQAVNIVSELLGEAPPEEWNVPTAPKVLN